MTLADFGKRLKETALMAAIAGPIQGARVHPFVRNESQGKKPLVADQPVAPSAPIPVEMPAPKPQFVGTPEGENIPPEAPLGKPPITDIDLMMANLAKTGKYNPDHLINLTDSQIHELYNKETGASPVSQANEAATEPVSPNRLNGTVESGVVAPDITPLLPKKPLSKPLTALLISGISLMT
ncbi:MAG: hypothetical protein H7844_12955 [Nitrospirae bacterium YQR-1]